MNRKKSMTDLVGVGVAGFAVPHRRYHHSFYADEFWDSNHDGKAIVRWLCNSCSGDHSGCSFLDCTVHNL